MEVWRVENENQLGPYANCASSGLAFEEAMRMIDKHHDLCSRHPTARAERIADGHYGFRTRKSLDRWFDYFGEFGRDVLVKNGMKINVYEVPLEYLEDHDCQVIFDNVWATWVREEEWKCIEKTNPE